MIVDNGTQVHLVIAGLYDGMCGAQAGVLAFRPARLTRPVSSIVGGLVDGDPVRLSVRKSPDNAGFLLATFERLP